MRVRSLRLLVGLLAAALVAIGPVDAAKPNKATLWRPTVTYGCTNGNFNLGEPTRRGSVTFSRDGNDLTVTVQLRRAVPNAVYVIYPHGSPGSACNDTGDDLGTDTLTTDSHGSGSLTFTRDVVTTANIYFSVSLCSPDAQCQVDYLFSWPRVYVP